MLWSDGLTQVDGTVSATGGGFVETSGLDALAFGPTASVTAGLGGFWLLDPRDVVITNVSGAGPIGPGTVTPPPGSGDYTVSLTALQNALNAGSDVTITTVQPASSGYGDIILARQLSWTGTGNLTLLADRNLSIEAGVATARGDFTATAARNLDVGANMTATGDAAIALTATGGNLLVGRSSAGDIAVTTERGALSIAAPRGQVAIKRVSTHGGGIQVDAAEGTLDITAGTGILVQGGARGQWVRVGTETSASAVTLAAPDIDVLAGPGDFAEVVTGAGGALDAPRRRHHPPRPARRPGAHRRPRRRHADARGRPPDLGRRRRIRPRPLGRRRRPPLRRDHRLGAPGLQPRRGRRLHPRRRLAPTPLPSASASPPPAQARSTSAAP